MQLPIYEEVYEAFEFEDVVKAVKLFGWFLSGYQALSLQNEKV